MCTNIDRAVGATETRSWTVSASDTAAVVGSGDVLVLGTPVVITWMEQATLGALAPFMEPECTTVGIHVDVRHKVPSAVGDLVEVSATVSHVQGKKIIFNVCAVAQGEVLAEGTITRAHVVREGVFARPTHP